MTLLLMLLADLLLLNKACLLVAQALVVLESHLQVLFTEWLQLDAVALLRTALGAHGLLPSIA